uniref:Uncharacterized protein n=1 Tax=Oncorhynchus mykiss TaxID=8022 RepID=A0A8C7UGF7_ONCMY
FYGQPPIKNIPISEFQTFAVERLKRKLSSYEYEKRWFIQQEIYLFSYRFNDLLSKCKYYFLHRNNLQYERRYSKVSVFLSPFQDALDLVRTRKVYLKGGYVYIPHKDIDTIGLNDFPIRLSYAFANYYMACNLYVM